MHSVDIAKCIRTASGHIKTLNMARNKISDEGVEQVIKAICESQIEHVNLAANRISDKSVDLIVGALKTIKTLKILDL